MQKQRHLSAKPKRGSAVDTYPTVGVYCTNCNWKLFRYKKKNGTQSGLVKCYMERIVVDEDDSGASWRSDLYKKIENGNSNSNSAEECNYNCPNCRTRFARSSIIHGLPALKLAGGKVRMAKR